MLSWQRDPEVVRLRSHLAPLIQYRCRIMAVTAVVILSFFVPPADSTMGHVFSVGISGILENSAHSSSHLEQLGQTTRPVEKRQRVIEDKYTFDCDSGDLNTTVDAFEQHSACQDESVFEYEQDRPLPSVRGRLKQNIEFWVNIGAPEFILDIINNGYKIPFVTTPLPCLLKNNASSLNHENFVKKAIADLESNNLIERCSRPPIIVNPLTVSVQSNGKKRLILDLRTVNSHLLKQSIKYDDLRTVMTFLEKTGWMIKFDIHSAYHNVDIFPAHTEYLGFSWRYGNETKYFKFLVLPFGLSTGPYIFY